MNLEVACGILLNNAAETKPITTNRMICIVHQVPRSSEVVRLPWLSQANSPDHLIKATILKPFFLSRTIFKI